MPLRHRLPLQKLPLQRQELALFLAPLVLVAVIGGSLGTKRWLQKQEAQRPTPLPTPQPAYTVRVTSLRFSPDGQQFAMTNAEGKLSLHKASGARIKQLTQLVGMGTFDTDPIFSPDGSLLAYEDRGFIRIWSPATLKLVTSLSNPTWVVSQFAFSPDHQLLAAIVSKPGAATLPYPYADVSASDSIAVWDVNSGQLIVTPRKQQQLSKARGLVFSPDSKTVAVLGELIEPTQGDRTADTPLPLRPVAQLWDIAIRKPRWQVDVPRSALSCSFLSSGQMKGRQLEVRGVTTVRIDTRSGTAKPYGNEYASYLQYMESATYLFGGHIVAGSYQNEKFDFLDTATSQPLPLPADDRLRGEPFAFSPDGTRLLLQYSPALLQCYDLGRLKNWKQWLKTHRGQNLPALPLRWVLDLRTGKFVSPTELRRGDF